VAEALVDREAPFTERFRIRVEAGWSASRRRCRRSSTRRAGVTRTT